MISIHRAGKATVHRAGNVFAGRAAPKHAAGGSAEARSVPVVIVIATALVALLNYAFALIMLWVLPSDKYAVVASITALLLMFGTVAGASAPWVLAREVAVSAGDNLRRQHAIAFASIVTIGQAALAAAICEVIVSRYATSGVALTACSAVVAIFVAAAAVGYLQGTERFRLIASLRIVEVIVKIAAGATLVKLGLNALGAISGFTFGALLVLLGAAYVMRTDMLAIFRSSHQKWIRTAVSDRRLWASTCGIIGIQALTAVVASLDLVIASIMLAGDRGLANYQVAQVLGRIPFYVAHHPLRSSCFRGGPPVGSARKNSCFEFAGLDPRLWCSHGNCCDNTAPDSDTHTPCPIWLCHRAPSLGRPDGLRSWRY